MQDAAGLINPNDRRSAFRKWLDDPGKEEGKTDDLIAAELKQKKRSSSARCKARTRYKGRRQNCRYGNRRKTGSNQNEL
jgi:hypothetical protein